MFRCQDTRAIIIESMKQASLADRCGALHVGDILLSVGGIPLSRLTVDQVLFMHIFSHDKEDELR